MELNNSDLNKKHDRLVQLKRETYDKIYKKCLALIKLTSDAGDLICFFEFQIFYLGVVIQLSTFNHVQIM